MSICFQPSGVATSTDKFLVPFHIDNGLFLLLTPFPSPSLLVKLSNGATVDTAGLASDTVLVLVGRGLTDWLLQRQPVDLFAVPHAVPSMSGSLTVHRSVLARMKVAPQTAVPALETSSKHITFGDIFFETAPTKQMDDLCTGSVSEEVHRNWKTPASAVPFLKVLDLKNIALLVCCSR
jgi:hypothetical protein